MGTAFAVLENGGSVRVPIARRHGEGKASVYYKTVPFEATPDTDYIHKEGTLTFADGEVIKYVEITIVRTSY